MPVLPYPDLLQPLRIGGMTLKNRMLATSCLPHFLQGPETYPSESILAFVEGLAKAGAAIVTIPDRFDNTRMIPLEDVKRGPCWDPKDPSVDNYLSLMCESVHFQGSYITAQLSKFHSIPRDVGVYDHEEVPGPGMMTSLEPPPPPSPVKAITPEQMQLLTDEIVSRAKYYQSVGFDGIVLHCAYGYNVLAKFLSPVHNRREDQFGGSIKNRAAFPLSIARQVKESCGQDFYVEMQMSGDDMPEPDLLTFAHLCEGLVDVLQLRLADMDASHASTYNFDIHKEPPTLRFAEAIKRSGAKVLVAPNGGFHDPIQNNAYLAQGRTDLIALARPLICDPDYGTKIQQNRAEDIIPCLYCNKCHDHIAGLWACGCRVNPVMGIAHRVDTMTQGGSGQSKRVAVIGGGPAGMRAALMAAEAGHQVTLYEKSGKLGGQLLHADYADFKWALRAYKDHLIAQLKKDPNVTLLLETEPNPELIAAEEFDAVIAAVGAAPSIPNIAGLDSTPYVTPLEAFAHHETLGKRVAVIGGSETGTETALYLAESGHQVTVLTRSSYLASDGWSVHAYSLMKRRWEANSNFTSLTQAATQSVAPGQVTYQQGSCLHTLDCDSIIVSGGVHSRTEDALRYSSCAPQFFLIGDCNHIGNLHNCNRSALAAASKL